MVSGCTENVPPRPAAAEAQAAGGKRHAECLVCKHENDLACVDLVVDDKTPRATIDGKEYFFCSESCKKQCAKDPQKYLGTK
jgi:hypothetical protein